MSSSHAAGLGRTAHRYVLQLFMMEVVPDSPMRDVREWPTRPRNFPSMREIDRRSWCGKVRAGAGEEMLPPQPSSPVHRMRTAENGNTNVSGGESSSSVSKSTNQSVNVIVPVIAVSLRVAAKRTPARGPT